MQSIKRTAINSLLIAAFAFSGAFAQVNQSKYLYGIASWYGNHFEGQITASGAPYDSQSLTAGHRTLPFGTRVEVENLSNGKKVQVLINDRGPFEQNRIINLSGLAANILEFANDGTTFVKITVLEIATPIPLGAPSPVFGQDITPSSLTPAVTTPIAVPEVLDPVAEEAPAINIQETYPEDYDYYYDDGYGIYDEYAFNENTILTEDLLLSDLALLASIDEMEFMDDTFNDLDMDFKAQQCTSAQCSRNFADAPALQPLGFRPTEDFFIDDPLSNMIIGPEDQFYPVPSTPYSAPGTDFTLSPEEKRIIEENQFPYDDIFDDYSTPYSFQEEISSSLTSPTVPSYTNANHIYGQNNVTAPVARPVVTNIRNITNQITNRVTVTNYVTPPQSVYTNVFEYDSDSFYEEDGYYYEAVNELTLTNIVSTIPSNVQNTVQQSKIPGITGDNYYVVQVGAFGVQKNAMALYDKLRAKGYNAYITDVKMDKENLMRVRIGYFNTLEEAVQMTLNLEETLGISTSRIIEITE